MSTLMRIDQLVALFGGLTKNVEVWGFSYFLSFGVRDFWLLKEEEDEEDEISRERVYRLSVRGIKRGISVTVMEW